jgi:hypothetical protein
MMRETLFAGLVVSTCCVVSTALAADPGPSSGINVNVVNTPLPIQGSVNIGNLPANQAVTGSVSIIGTPNVNVANMPTVSVAGTVQTQSGIPPEAFTIVQGGVDFSSLLIRPVAGPDPGGTAYAITSMTFSNNSDGPGKAQIFVLPAQAGVCNPAGFYDSRAPLVAVPARGTVHLTFPQPLVLPIVSSAGCLWVNAEPNIGESNGITVAVVGFKTAVH